MQAIQKHSITSTECGFQNIQQPLVEMGQELGSCHVLQSESHTVFYCGVVERNEFHGDSGDDVRVSTVVTGYGQRVTGSWRHFGSVEVTAGGNCKDTSGWWSARQDLTVIFPRYVWVVRMYVSDLA
jgi:hypothetical protein